MSTDTTQAVDPTPIAVTDRAFNNRNDADRIFRTALQRGHYPVVPDSVLVGMQGRDRLDGLAAQLKPFVGPDDIIREAAAALVAGEPVDAQGLQQRLVQAHSEQEAARFWPRAFDALTNTVRQQWYWTLSLAAPEMLAGLHEQLVHLMDDVRAAVADLDGLNVADTTAIALAKDSQRDAFLNLRGLVTPYAVLRTAQCALYAVAMENNPGWSVGKSALFPRGMGPVTDGVTWDDVFASGVHEARFELAYQAPPPRTEDPTGAVVRLIHLAGRDDLWVPEPAQLEDQWDALP